MSDIYYIIVPVVVVVVILKLCLIFWRVWVYQKRREQRAYIIRQQRMAATATTARVVQVERVCGPGGMAQRTSYAINQPGQPTRHVTRTIVLRAAPDGRRPLDPNLPPTYEAAVTGRDHSVKVEDGKAVGPTAPVPSGQLPQSQTLAQPQIPVPSAPPPAFSIHQPPPGPPPGPPPNMTSCLPPAYTPSPSAPVLMNNDDDDDEIDADDRRRLLA